ARAGHILQPHSIELEELAELGLVGLVLFGGLWVLVLRAPDRRDKPVAAAATRAAIVLLAHAAGGWTWSFPGLGLPGFLVAGARAGGGLVHGRTRRRREVATALAAALALVALAGPYLAHRALDSAANAQTSDPAHALSRARDATRLDPWSPGAYELRGQ